MKVKNSQMLVSIIFLLISSFPTNVFAETCCNVAGTLKDNSGNPIIVSAQLVNGTNVYIVQSSSLDGSFNFTVPSAVYDIKFISVTTTANMPRFFDAEKPVLIHTDLFQNLVPMIFKVYGKLTDSNNNILSGATVDSGVCTIGINGFTGTQEDVVTTDSNGNYTMHIIPSNCPSLKITESNGLTFFPNSGRTINVTSNDNMDIKLATPITQTGQVKDSSNNPISSTVQFVDDNSNVVETTQTNSSGKYSIKIPVGNYTLKFSNDNTNIGIPRFFDLEKHVSLNSDQVNNVILNVTSVSGTAHPNYNSTMVDVRDVLLGSSYTGFSSDRVLTDSLGHFMANLLTSNVSSLTVTNDTNGNVITCSLSGGTSAC